MPFNVCAPLTDADFKTYYSLRYSVLRKPWGQPLGSEKDETDPASIHAMIKVNEEAVAIARLHFVDDKMAQVRYMAVHQNQQGKGLGKLVLNYLEEKAKENKRNVVILHARETAVKFYENCGYKIKERSYLMWDQIQHFLMEKNLEK